MNNTFREMLKTINDTKNIINTTISNIDNIKKNISKHNTLKLNRIDYLSFNKESRKRIVRDILCQQKSIIDSEQEYFDCIFNELTYLRCGFGFNFILTLRDSDCIKKSESMDVFFSLKDYLNNIFNYIFNKDIDVSCYMNEEEMTVNFEIISRY